MTDAVTGQLFCDLGIGSQLLLGLDSGLATTVKGVTDLTSLVDLGGSFRQLCEGNDLAWPAFVAPSMTFENNWRAESNNILPESFLALLSTPVFAEILAADNGALRNVLVLQFRGRQTSRSRRAC